VKGATYTLGERHRVKGHFNPRAREGRDPGQMVTSLPSIAISIHAPVKGATSHNKKSFRSFAHFNPRAREGRDAYWLMRQSSLAYFNPRAREGHDRA